MTRTAGLVDAHGRLLRDLRVSVTDRCNFRCVYCLPETEEAADFYRSRAAATAPPAVRLLKPWKPRHQLLSFEEIERAVRLFVRLGIRKVRLTGGEPLLRNDLPLLVERLSRIPGIEDLALTTNGFRFAAHATALRQAGLQRVSFSLDSLDRANFLRLTGRDALHQVLHALALARDLGFAPLKVNAVVIRDLNDHEVEALAEFAVREGVALRFIEFMPLDSARAWQRELVVPGREILDRLRRRFDLCALPLAHPSATAQRWGISGTSAEIGIIAPVTEPFCGHCNRIRLTADGQIRTCLFSISEHDLKSRLRQSPADDTAIATWLQEVALTKELRHHIGETDFHPPERSMSCIGG